jgi:protein ImuB
LKALHLRLLLEGARPAETVLRPAAPTRDPALLLDLLRLRLEALTLGAGVNGLELLAEGEVRVLEQLGLFPAPEAHDLAAANRALARLRAEFGEAAVVRARLAGGHLPEAAFAWEPLAALPALKASRATQAAVPPAAPAAALAAVPVAAPVAAPEAMPRLVRRLLGEPLALPVPAGPLAPGALAHALGQALGQTLGCGALERLHGPWPLSGGWWGEAWHRDYYVAETHRGDLLWLFHDRRGERWCLHGRVE